MAATTDVMITLEGVRVERLPRLRTLLRSEVQRFGSKMIIKDDLPVLPPKRKK